MKKALLGFMFIGIIILGFKIIPIIPAYTHPAPTVMPTAVPTVAIKPINGTLLQNAVNVWRVDNGHSYLPEEESLCSYASKRAEDIKNDWSHNIFQIDKCNQVNFPFCGENLAKGYYTEEEVLNAWIQSPTHLDNLQNIWSAMCIKCSDNYCAQEFGR